MPNTVRASKTLLGSGKLYIDEFDASDVKTGEFFLGNCESFEMTPTVETVKMKSSADSLRGLICSDVVGQEMALRIVGKEFSLENLARLFFGDLDTFGQGSGTASDEVLTTASIQGRYYPTEFRDISSVVVTGPSGSPVHVVDDDYTVDAETGRIYIVEGGGIADDSTVETDYSYAAYDVNIVEGMNVQAVRGFLRYIPDNVRGPKMEYLVWRTSFRPDGAVSLIGSDYASWTLVGEIENDAENHPLHPHYMAIERNT